MTPAQLVDFMCYDEGTTLLGLTDVTMPELSFMTETLSGAGIPGEMEIPGLGQTESMTATINFRSLTEENAALAAPRTRHLEFWGSEETYDAESGEMDTKQIKVILRGMPKKQSMGNFEKNTMMNPTLELEVYYYKLVIGGKDMVEIDKFNNICIISGTDYLEKVRKDIGMA